MSGSAVIFAAPRRIEIREIPLPRPGRGQVVVAAELSGISAGTEMLIYRGQTPHGMAVDATIPALQEELMLPMKFGYSMVGRVMDVGEGVGREWAGRRVFAFHPHESHFLTVPQQLTPLPDDVDASTAILLPNMETAVNLVHDGRPLVGERVAVFGQGIVGLLTTSLLRRFPLEELITVDPIAARRAVSLLAGAHASVDADSPPDGCDLVYELSGHPATLNHAIAATGFSGRVVIGSWYGSRRAEIDLGGAFHRSRIQIRSSQVSTIDPALSGAWTKRRRLDLAMSLLRDIQPARFITHRFPVEDAPMAYALLDERPHEAIQVALTYGSA